LVDGVVRLLKCARRFGEGFWRVLFGARRARRVDCALCPTDFLLGRL
jgi:hypothetical protein